jgi:hypothetical protein
MHATSGVEGRRDKVAKEFTRIYPCFPSRSAAPSAAPTSRCLHSLNLPTASTESSPLARRATRPATQHSTSRSLDRLADLLWTRAALSRAESAERSRLSPNSACPAAPRKHEMPSTVATARRAAQSARSSGSWTTLDGRRQTSESRFSPPTVSPWTTTTGFCDSRAAHAPSAVAPKGPHATASCFECQSTMIMRLAPCGESCAIPATVRSASSERTSRSFNRPSPICCDTKKSSLDNGEGYCPSPIHRGGQ